MAAPTSSAEAAMAAARQAEFNEKKWVWIPDVREGYLAAWVMKEEEKCAEVVMALNGEHRHVSYDALFKMNPPKFDRVEDIADLTFLNEASVVHNLRLRYGSEAIYTYSGLFLVAINPYQSLPLYSDAIIQQYRGKRRDENPPHIFAVAERAWVNMGDERENQSILITGESGAGKTESTKKVIQYLAAIATDVHDGTHARSSTLGSTSSFAVMPSMGLPRSNSVRRGHAPRPSRASVSGSGSFTTARSRLGLLERQILQANPILEAFGNAQTQRNNNSSRFGKFIRINFAPDGSIAGANIDWYLLEKSRVVVRSEAERSFHVFYQLLAAGGALKDGLLLDSDIEHYNYLNKSRREVDGVDDTEEWHALKGALDVVGFTVEEQFDLFRIVAAILHIGNVEFSGKVDNPQFADPSQVERVCYLLGIPYTDFENAILRPRVLAGREWVQQARTKTQALDELASLCKTIYEKSFGSLVERINRALDRPSSKSTFIGVLDIAGFEIFEINTYEQLLINYTNEKLQQFFNHHMFVLEQEEYAREGIQWDYVNFGLDLQPTIDLIETSGNAIGILSCLDEECIMPKATDRTLTDKLHALWATHDPQDGEPHPGKFKYEPSRFHQGFIVQHYAAKVEYRTEGWLEKNKDPLNDNLTRVMSVSSQHYVASLFADYGEPTGNGALTQGRRRVIKKGAFRTVGQRHKEQLASLMAQLQATQPHFVRCIVPNTLKKPNKVDVPLVLDQLRCNGVLEGIRIARLGYPNRLPFVEFRQRYEILTPGVIPRGYMDGREACRRMVKALELDESIFRIGTSKIFFKAGVLAELEESRDRLLFDIFSRLQAVARMWTARRQMKKVLNRAVAIRTIQRNARVYGDLREWPWWQLYTKIRPLLAATRSDEELRKKEAELAAIKERADRDKQQREALESLKMSLEAEKKDVEEALEAERALVLDKSSLLERAKRNEAELQEELETARANIETLEAGLERALTRNKESDETRKELQALLMQATERLEMEEKNKEKLTKLTEELSLAQEAIDTTRTQLKVAQEEAQSLARQREEDLARAKERLEAVSQEYQEKLNAELQAKRLIKERTDQLEDEARQSQKQLSEYAHTATDYSNMLQKKDKRILELNEEIRQLKKDREKTAKEVASLQSDVDTLIAQLNAEKTDHERESTSRSKLQHELDELRALLQAKSTEETRRDEAQKSKEAELAELRAQAAQLNRDLVEARQSALEAQGKLKLEHENSTREIQRLKQEHGKASEKEVAAKTLVTQLEAKLSDLEKSKRALEADMASLQFSQTEVDKQLADAMEAKTAVEAQLRAAQAKYHDFEDVVLQFQRDKESHQQQLKALQEHLKQESTKRTELEKQVTKQKSELTRLRDRNVKLDRELQQAKTDLEERKLMQNKTIVEHVRVHEEAKKLAERQLEAARQELRNQDGYIKSLERIRSRLAGEAEDIKLLTERDRAEVKSKQKEIKNLEEQLNKMVLDKQNVELESHRLRNDLTRSQIRTTELEQELQLVKGLKAQLDGELEALVREFEAPESGAAARRNLEARITDLEQQLTDARAQSAQHTARTIKQLMERQHAEIRALVMNNHTDSNFQARLLSELKRADDGLEREMSALASRMRAEGGLTNGTSTDSPSKASNSSGRRPRESLGDRARSEEQINALKQHVQALELQMAASDRVRRHLETTIRGMTDELQNGDLSEASLAHYRSRLLDENSRLGQLLDDEAAARRAAEAAQFEGVQSMWDKFKDMISVEQESYAKLEESRKALLIQQRTTQTELEMQKSQLRETVQDKKRLEAEAQELRAQLDAASSEARKAQRQLKQRHDDEEISLSATSSKIRELQTVVETFKAKEADYQKRLEKAEIERATAARGEAFARRTLADAEKMHSEAVTSRKGIEERLTRSDKQVQELQAKVEEDGHRLDELSLANQRLSEELEDEREHFQKELEVFNETRNKYQATLAEFNEQTQRLLDQNQRDRGNLNKLRLEHQELKAEYDKELSNRGGWKKEKERLEEKIAALDNAYKKSMGVQIEQQEQVLSLHSQLNQLRTTLEQTNHERELLQNARQALSNELKAIRENHADISRFSSDREFQQLQLEKQDLERTLDEQRDRVANAHDRMKRAETHLQECQLQLSRVQQENTELDRHNAALQKEVENLKVRIVDLETKSHSPRPPSSRRESRIEELTNQLQGGRQRVDSTHLRPKLPGELRAKFERP
ncbi:hypothetical protein AX16_002172 [Volvariella volvacea WC 439]|nr:hypothetical protein AX16_002172 [Volvariella volvacea WC 439]